MGGGQELGANTKLISFRLTDYIRLTCLPTIPGNRFNAHEKCETMSGFQTLNPASPGGYTWLQAGVLVPLSWIKTILVRTSGRALEAPGTDKIS
jgi:hypothetical protein